jgi:glycosyltransferase involved in cell wall biosynthesis
LRHLITKHKPDLIHTFNKRSLTNVLLATFGADVPIIGYRGIIGNVSPWNPESRMIFFNRRVRRIICVCHAVEASLNGIGIPNDRTVTIHKGHDITWYEHAERASFEEWRIPEDAFIIGCAARMRPRKGIPVLVKAIAKLSDPRIHLILAGEITDPEVMPLIEKHSLQDNIHPIGFRKDVCGLMGACDVFVMPSLRREGLPRAVIEAMAQRTPAIVTSVGGMPELVRHEKDGLVIPPDSVDALADAIRRLAAAPDLLKSYGEEARRHIIDSFDINKTVDQTLGVYDSVLKG